MRKEYSFFRNSKFFLAICLCCATSLFSIELSRDTFTSGFDGWSGTNVTYDSTGDRLRINRDNTASKLFSYPAYANRAVSVTLTATKINTWESSDLFKVVFNSVQVYNSNTTGTITLEGVLNASGELRIELTPDTNADVEDIYIDNVIIATIDPTLSVANASIAEGNSGITHLNFTITLSSSADVNVSYATSNGTATAGSDYTATSGILTFTTGGGITTKTIAVPIVGDTTVEPNETLTLTLSNPLGATLANATATGTITNDDISGFVCANPKPFQIASSNNINGNVRVIGNSNLCYNYNGTCGDPGNARNNDINMMYSDPDGNANPSTFNSSSALVSLPSGATVKWAKVYWQGYLVNKDDATKTASKSILFAKPNSPYQTINTTTLGYQYHWIYFTADRYYYQGSADVTSLLQAGGNGYYSVANIVSEIGQPIGGSYGAWAIVVVYEDAMDTLKNITVFDGYQGIVTSGDQTSATNYAAANGCSNGTGTGNSMSIPLFGFLTPSSGAVNSRLAIFAGEGDKGATGDHLFLTDKNNVTQQVYNTLNPSDDLFNSTITYNGSTVTGLTSPVAISPYYSANSNGIDIDTFDVGTSSATTKIIGNSQTSTVATLNTDGDGYMPGVFAFSTDIYAPNLVITKTPSSGASTTLQPGNQIDYTVFFKNTGKEAAKDVVIFDDFTQNMLRKTNGESSNPAVYLSDILERNSTKILQSIKLSDVNSTSIWHCAQGLSGLSGCNVYDANCSVDFSGDPQTSATKVWCSIPKIDINASYTMTFSVNIAQEPDTKNQEVFVENQVFATYKDNVTGVSMPNASSNLASAGTYASMADGLFDAWESSLSRTNPKLYTKIVNDMINVDIGKKDGSAFTGTVCARILTSTQTLIADYQCFSYSNLIHHTFGWSNITTAYQNAYIHIQTSTLQNQMSTDINSDWTDSNSTDNFSIRPDHFTFNPIASKLKAGEDYDLSVHAYPASINTDVPGYNQSKTGLTLSLDKRRPDTTIDNALAGNVNFSSHSFSFTDGITSTMGITYSDVGTITLKLDDTNWTSVDASDDGLNPIANRTIHGEVNVTFIPFDFNISNVLIRDHNNSNFTYLSNDLNMSAEIGMTITARNKQGNTTQNYSNNLYEQNISIIPTIRHGVRDANKTSSSNVDLNFTNGTAIIAFGEAEMVQFNFDKNTSKPENPFDVNGADVNITVLDTDAVQGDANQTATGTARFYYGRVHAPDYRFPNRDGNATIYYEVYCKDCNATFRNNMGITGNESVNALHWYQNVLHVNATDGGVTPQPTTPSHFLTNTITHANPISIEHLTLKNTTPLPYVDRINFNSDSWLQHYPTYFTVEFFSSGSWAGSGFVKQDHTNATDTNTTVGEHIHKIAPVRSNKRMSW